MLGELDPAPQKLAKYRSKSSLLLLKRKSHMVQIAKARAASPPNIPQFIKNMKISQQNSYIINQQVCTAK